MSPSSIRLKKLDLSELRLLHKWLNDQDASGDYDGTHQCTFEQVKELFNSGGYERLRMFYIDDLPIGWGEILGEGTEVRLSIQISRPNYRGRKFGETLHRLLIEDFKIDNTTSLYIVAWTHIQNLAERKILEKIGFLHYPDENKMFDINGTQQEFCLYEYKI